MDPSALCALWLTLTAVVVAMGPGGVEAHALQEGQEAAQGAVAEIEPAPLSERHREWLDKEVRWIIADEERDAFRQLPSDEERDAFIEVFWQVRDPTPGTLANEVREEHYRRLRYAERYLGRETPRQGWQTERGRIYIQLGEPQEVQRHHDPKSFWPMELWFYEANPRATDLPPFFYVLFYRANGGEFQLYDPLTDGPESLAKQITMQLSDRGQIVQRLLQGVGHDVALASVNLNPAERVSFSSPSPSPGNAIILRNIQAAPTEGVDTSYTETFLRHRGTTEAIVTFNTVPVDVTALAFWDERGQPYLHYAARIPAEKVTIGEYEGDYYFRLDIDLEVRDPRGNLIVDGFDDLEEHFGEERAMGLVRRPFAYFDRIELVPGLYSLDLALSNPVSRERGVAGVRALVPAGAGDDWEISDLLVADRTVALDRMQRQAGERAFRFGDEQFVPLAGSTVAPGRTLELYAQVMPPAGVDRGTEITARATLRDRDGRVVESRVGLPLPLREGAGPTEIRHQLPLPGTARGEYRVGLTVELPGGRTLSRQRAVRVDPSGGGPPPEILMSTEAPAGTLTEYFIRGSQHQRKGELQAAEQFFRAGLQIDPSALQLKRPLARLLLAQERYEEAVAVLRELQRHPAVVPGDLLSLSEALRGAGQAGQAVLVAREVLRRWTPTPVAYNELAAAALAAGDVGAAIEAFEASLVLDPDQPRVREELERLR